MLRLPRRKLPTEDLAQRQPTTLPLPSSDIPTPSRTHPGDPAPLPQGRWVLAQPQNYLHISGFLQMQALLLLPRRSDPFGFTVSKTAPCLASFSSIPGRSTHFHLLFDCIHSEKHLRLFWKCRYFSTLEFSRVRLDGVLSNPI